MFAKVLWRARACVLHGRHAERVRNNLDLFTQRIVLRFGVEGWQGARPLPVAADSPGVTHQRLAGLTPSRHLGLEPVMREPLI